MIFSTRSREQKMVDHLYPFFGEIAQQVNSHHIALETCERLIDLHGSALQDPVLLPLLDIWQCECPEESNLDEDELHWALMSLQHHVSRQLYNIGTGGTRNPVPEHAKMRLRAKAAKAQFRVINGGKSEKPDRPVE